MVSDDFLKERKVKLGLTNFKSCEVREGLDPDAVVVVDEVHKLKDGQRVRVNEATEELP